MADNPMQGTDGRNPTKPAVRIFTITPDDNNDLPVGTRAIIATVSGTLKVTLVDDGAAHAGVTLPATYVVPGREMPVACRRVYATGTTATGLIGLA